MSGLLLANFLGFLALLCYVLTLLPGVLRIIFSSAKFKNFQKNLMKNRRLIGVLAFYLALCHGALLIAKRNFDFFDIKTYGTYVQGILTFIVFALLTLTSNDWSIKKLKKGWKNLHRLTYTCMLLLTWHVWEKMSGHWSLLTPICVSLMFIITVLFSARKWVESSKSG